MIGFAIISCISPGLGDWDCLMKYSLVLLISFAALNLLKAEVVFANLNSSSSASVGSGFTWYAQRFTTNQVGTGLHLDLNIISQSGSQNYDVQLWSADGAGTNVGALLATIGSGTVTSSDKTAVTSFDLTYSLNASTDYFVKLIASSGSFGFVIGPNDAATLNSVTRYGVGNLNNTTNSALAMQVDVATVPEPGTLLLGGMAAGLGGVGTWWRRRRKAKAGG